MKPRIAPKVNSGHSATHRVSALSVLSLLLILGGTALAYSHFHAKPLVDSAQEIKKTVSPPARFIIDKLNIDAPVVKIGLTPSQELQVPARASDVGWYQYFPAPGEKGPAVMVGHLDSYFGPGVFVRLKELKPGDKISVINEAGERISFEVEKSENVEQDNFPTNEVYGDIDYPGLRVITCSGKFNPFKARYSHNLVVFAKKID